MSINVEKMMAKKDIKGLFKLMTENKGELRTQAIKALHATGKEAVTPLLVLVKKKEAQAEERQRAIAVIKAIGAQAVDPLLAAIEGNDDQCRQVALQSLGAIGDPRSGEPILALLKKDDQVSMLSKLVAVGISAQIMGVRAQDGLLEYLLEGTSTFVLFRAYNVAKALGDIGDEKSMNILVELTGTHFRDAYIETDSKTRAAAAEALGKVAGRLKNRTEIEKAESALVELLKDQNPGLRAYAGLALGQIIDNHAAKPLIAALKDSDPLVRSTAALGLAGSLDRIKVEPLIAALGAADADMRANAAKGLMGGTGEDPRALAALIGCQKDPAAAVRSAAVQSLLGFAKEQGVFEHLLLCLKDGDPGVRSSALLVLGLMGERAIEPLINGFKDADAKVRSQAVTHMSKFKDPRVVNTICEGLKDQDPVVRLTCVLSLSENGTPQAADGLAFALNDPVEIVRQEAARVMEKRKTVPGKDSRKTDREAK